MPTGSTRTVEFVADNPGDWGFHCHKSHHAMNAMNHDVPNVLGVDQTKLKEALDRFVPGSMVMGTSGMAEHAEHADHSDHQHGPECGHEAIQHGDHLDYVHDGHRHAPHGEHYDEH